MPRKVAEYGDAEMYRMGPLLLVFKDGQFVTVKFDEYALQRKQ